MTRTANRMRTPSDWSCFCNNGLNGRVIGQLDVDSDKLILINESGGQHTREASGAKKMVDTLHTFDRPGQKWTVWKERHQLGPGGIFPRVARNRIKESPAEVVRSSLLALRVILRDLERVFDVVEPNPANYGVYGHRLRQLLLLACMEVEAGWKAVAAANNLRPQGGKHLTTTDYFHLRDLLHLHEYSVRLQHYGGQQFRPFATWKSNAPTKSLSWYDAYNQTKHDREKNMSLATLGHVLEATAGAYVLIIAQFGEEAVKGSHVDLPGIFWFDHREDSPSYGPHEWYFPDARPGATFWTLTPAFGT